MPNADQSIIGNPDRLAALKNLCLLDTATDPAFDRITNLASRILKVPISTVTLVDEDRQFFKSQVGLPETLAQARQTSLSHSFCQHVVALNQPLIVTDAREHPLVYDNLAIPDNNVIAYAGIPLMTSDGNVIGSFCAIDNQPRVWSTDDIAILTDLAALVMTEIELHVKLQEREKINAQLAESERFVRQTIAAIPASISIYDVQSHRINFLNDKIETISGYSLKDLQNMAFLDMVALLNMDYQPRQSHVPNAYSDIKQMYENLYQMHRKDGTVRWLNISSVLFTSDADGNPSQLLTIASDVTNNRLAEQHALDLNLEREQVRILQEFIDTMSHDLRTPLTLIQTSLYLLKRQHHFSNEAEMKRVNIIEDQTKQLVMILDDLEMMAELDKSRTINNEMVDIGMLTRGVVEYIHDTFRLSDEYKVAIDIPEEPIMVMMTVTQMQIALNSIIKNAFIYSEKGSTIGVRLYRQKKQVIVEVQDTGLGIEAEDLPNIFKRLYKVNKARTQNHSGSGLGLAMVKRIMELHEGEVEVESHIGVGSIFRLILPVRHSRIAQPQ